MKERNIAIAVVIIIVALVAGLTYFVNAQKSADGYTGEYMKAALVNVEKFFLGINALIVLALTAISAMAYARVKTMRFALLTLAFTILTLDVLLKIADRYFIPGSLVISPIDSIFVAGFMVVLALAVFRKC